MTGNSQIVSSKPKIVNNSNQANIKNTNNSINNNNGSILDIINQYRQNTTGNSYNLDYRYNNSNNNEPITETTEKLTGSDAIKQNYENYIKELDAQKVSAENEIAIAEQNTQKYLDNYLKQQGIYGSGLGSTLALGNVVQANQNRNALTQAYNASKNEAYQNYQDSITEYFEQYNQNQLEEAITKIDNLVANGATKEEIQEYLSDYQNDNDLDSDTKDYINEYLNDFSGATSWSDSRDEAVNSIAQLILNSDNQVLINNLSKIADKFRNSKTYDEYNEALEEYEKLVQNEALAGQNVNEIIDSNLTNSNLNSNSAKNIKTLKEFYDLMDTGIMVGATHGGKQDDLATKVLTNAKNDKLNNNIIIDINYGGGEDYILYSNGVFYSLGDSIPSQYSNLKVYDEKNIDNAIKK